MMKKLIKMICLGLLICVMAGAINVNAASYGTGYTFDLQPSGGVGDMSPVVIKENQNSYATVFVNSYSSKGYYTRYFVTATEVTNRSSEVEYPSTGSFYLYYQYNANGLYHKGEKHVLNGITSSNNPNYTTVSGSWAP